MRKSNDTINAFAQHHRLKTVVNDCGELIIPGKRNTANHVFFYGNWSGASDPRTFGVMFMPDPHGKRPPTREQWNNRRRALEAAGCAIVCDADGEGYARFDPTDARQLQTALRVAGIRPMRQLNPEYRELLRARASGLRRITAGTA
jgi:hypothetical protein